MHCGHARQAEHSSQRAQNRVGVTIFWTDTQCGKTKARQAEHLSQKAQRRKAFDMCLPVAALCDEEGADPCNCTTVAAGGPELQSDAWHCGAKWRIFEKDREAHPGAEASIQEIERGSGGGVQI